MITSANRQRVDNISDLRHAVGNGKHDQLLLRVIRGDMALYLVLQ